MRKKRIVRVRVSESQPPAKKPKVEDNESKSESVRDPDSKV